MEGDPLSETPQLRVGRERAGLLYKKDPYTSSVVSPPASRMGLLMRVPSQHLHTNLTAKAVFSFSVL